MARAADLTRHTVPWDPAPGTAGTPGGLLRFFLHSGIAVFFHVMAVFVSQILPSGKRVKMLFAAVLDFP